MTNLTSKTKLGLKSTDKKIPLTQICFADPAVECQLWPEVT